MTTELQRRDPATLYRRWEDSQWSPYDVDLAVDHEQWGSLADDQRGLIHFVLASLMVAEERITTKFTGLVAAGADEEEVTFLATQQVDEARHMQFYARYQDEVVASPTDVAAHVARAREQVSEAFRQIFDVALVRPGHAPRAAPPRRRVAQAARRRRRLFAAWRHRGRPAPVRSRRADPAASDHRRAAGEGVRLMG